MAFGPRRPRFTVVIPALDEERLLPLCLDALAAQNSTGGVEVVVVDNDSSDRTADIARAKGARVVREPVRGVCAARQAGSVAAHGEIIVSTDADTTFPPGWLSAIDRSFADPGVVAVTGPPHFVDAPWWGRAYEWLLFRLVHLVYVTTGRVWYVSATNIAFRREAFPGYDTRLTQGGDEWDLLRRLRTRGRVVFDLRNRTLTSSRRLQRGLAYNVLVSCLYYYVLGYVLNRATGRTVLGMAPAIRTKPAPDPSPAPRSRRDAAMRTLAAIALFAAVGGVAMEWAELV